MANCKDDCTPKHPQDLLTPAPKAEAPSIGVVEFPFGEACGNPLFVEVCNPQPVQVIRDAEQLGCTLDGNGDVDGRVFLVQVFDTEGTVTGHEMMRVALDGTVTRPYTGTWSPCTSDLDLTQVSQVSEIGCANDVPWRVITTTLFSADGVELSSSAQYVDSAGNSQAVAPAGFTLGACSTAVTETGNRLGVSDIVGCAEGASYIERNIVEFNDTGIVGIVETQWIDANGLASGSRPTGFAYGPCGGGSGGGHTTVATVGAQGCAAGVPWTRVTTLYYVNATDNDPTLRHEYVDSAGNVQDAAPAGFTLGSCDVGSTPATEVTRPITYVDATGPYTVPANAMGVTVNNVGDNAGVLMGTPIAPGESVSYSGYYDPSTNELVKLPEVGVDGTGTILHIARQA